MELHRKPEEVSFLEPAVTPEDAHYAPLQQQRVGGGHGVGGRRGVAFHLHVIGRAQACVEKSGWGERHRRGHSVRVFVASHK
jgi:hypothetical protein